MADKSAPVAPISKGDRMELRRIVKARFEVLREQLGQRANELHRVVKKQIEEDAQADIVKAENEGIKLAKKCRDLGAEIDTYNKKWSAKGLANKGSAYEAAKEMQNDIISYFLSGWDVANLNERTNKIVGEIKNQHGLHGLELRTNELQLLEDLSVDAIQGEQAKEFMSKIPVIDTLLPLPEAEARKALVAGR